MPTPQVHMMLRAIDAGYSGDLLAKGQASPRVHRGPLPLATEASLLRREIVEAIYASGGGHYGGSLSVIDVLITLYRRQLRTLSSYPKHPDRDRLVLSKGHAAIALYAVLRRLEFFDYPLQDYARFGSPLEGHPDMTTIPGVDFSTGSLGQGASVGAGMAFALRGGQRIWVILGDGECQEGQVWETATLAAQYGLDHLHLIVDCNRFQEWGWRRTKTGAGEEHVPPPVPDLAKKWASFGWRVWETDGHDHAALSSSFQEMIGTQGSPSILIAHTTKGKGFKNIEVDPIRFHCTTMTEAEHLAALGARDERSTRRSLRKTPRRPG